VGAALGVTWGAALGVTLRAGATAGGEVFKVGAVVAAGWPTAGAEEEGATRTEETGAGEDAGAKETEAGEEGTRIGVAERLAAGTLLEAGTSRLALAEEGGEQAVTRRAESASKASEEAPRRSGTGATELVFIR
jgi:hypothetical protein